MKLLTFHPSIFILSTRSIKMKVRFERFGGIGVKQLDTRTKAAEFATGIGRENVISLSEGFQEGVFFVTVWYWD